MWCINNGRFSIQYINKKNGYGEDGHSGTQRFDVLTLFDGVSISSLLQKGAKTQQRDTQRETTTTLKSRAKMYAQ